MALTPNHKVLTFSADTESALAEAVSKSLDGVMNLNMGIRRCAAFPAVNNGHFLCELTTKETKSVLTGFLNKVRERTFVEHAVIQLLYIPVILNTTVASACIKLKNLATGDELYGGTKVNLNQAFVLTLTWPRSLFADDVAAHKGLFLGGTVDCASSIPAGGKIGMWYPFWSEKISKRQLYQKTTAVTSTLAMETYAKAVIKSDAEMRALMMSYASVDNAAKAHENLVTCSKTMNLLESGSTGIDFTVKQLPERSAESPDDTDRNVEVSGVTDRKVDVLIPRFSSKLEERNGQVTGNPPKGGFLT